MKSMSSPLLGSGKPIGIADMTDDEFPSYYAKRDLKLEEEKRLFYVALTRAKCHLVVTSNQNNEWNRQKPPSGFLNSIR